VPGLAVEPAVDNLAGADARSPFSKVLSTLEGISMRMHQPTDSRAVVRLRLGKTCHLAAPEDVPAPTPSPLFVDNVVYLVSHRITLPAQDGVPSRESKMPMQGSGHLEVNHRSCCKAQSIVVATAQLSESASGGAQTVRRRLFSCTPSAMPVTSLCCPAIPWKAVA